MERTVTFTCEADRLFGILNLPGGHQRLGLLVLVGGPQYRVGSHRQFVLLSRAVARAGFPVMRFDYRGRGDSEGEFRGYEYTKLDIRHALDEFTRNVPGLEGVVLWGLCDAATSAGFYANTDERVRGLVLVNPWINLRRGRAVAFLKYYYLNRVLRLKTWNQVISGDFSLRRGLHSFADFFRTYLKRLPELTEAFGSPVVADPSPSRLPVDTAKPLARQLLGQLRRFSRPTVFILSGNDLTATEFKLATNSSLRWMRLMRSPHVCSHELTEADHTFSSREWRDMAEQWTVAFLQDQAAGKT